MVQTISNDTKLKLEARQVTKLGVQCLWYAPDEDCYYVSIKNRTYSSIQPIPKDKADVWRNLLGG